MARIGAISIASCFRIIGLLLSGPAALCGFVACDVTVKPTIQHFNGAKNKSGSRRPPSDQEETEYAMSTSMKN